MQRSSPFARSIEMMRLIAVAMSMPSHLRQQEISAIGQYESRGKGHGITTYARSGTNAQAQRAAKKARNVAKNRAAHR